MLGLGTGLSLAAGGAISVVTHLSQKSSTAKGPIVAWGDSLTYGYPALAAALFDPPRDVVEQAVGGQTSTAVAARQGGVPILVTLAGDQIPALLPAVPHLTWDFSEGDVPSEWSAFSATGAPVSLICAEGTLRADLVNTAPNFFLAGPQVKIGPLAEGQILRVEFDIVEMTGIAQLQVGTLFGNWTQAGSPQLTLTQPGSYAFEAEITDDKDGGLIELGFVVLSTETMTGVLRLANVKVFKDYAPNDPVVAVTALTVEPLNSQGPWIDGVRRIEGTLMGVAGALEYDGVGEFAFKRTDVGHAQATTAGSIFVPGGAVAQRNHTAWIWVGRNNILAPETVTSDIAAMVQYLGHRRYLIGSILNSADEATGTDHFEIIEALNAQLAEAYGQRFVDVRVALLAAHDGSAVDLDDIATGVPPRSLRSDPIHLNSAGQAVAAQAFYAATAARGW